MLAQSQKQCEKMSVQGMALMDQAKHGKKVYASSPSIHSQYCPTAALHPSYGWKDHQNEHNIAQNHAAGLPSLDLHRPR